MVKVENSIYAGGTSVGTHEQLIPVLFTVWGPLCSTDTCGSCQPERTPAPHIPSHDPVRSRMRTLKALDERLESDIIARVRAHGVIDHFSRERRVDRDCRIQSRWTVGAGSRSAGVGGAGVRTAGVGRPPGVKGEFPAEVM